MVTFTLNLTLIGILFAAYYLVSVVTSLILVLITHPKDSRPQLLNLLPRVLILGPLLPYLLIKESIQTKRESETLNRYRTERGY